MSNNVVVNHQKGVSPSWETFERAQAGAQYPDWLDTVHKTGMTQFAEVGFPTLEDEDWRFTNVNPITRLPFKLDSIPAKLNASAVTSQSFSSIKASRLVFIDGKFSTELSSIPAAEGWHHHFQSRSRDQE